MKISQLLEPARTEVMKPYEEKLEQTEKIIDNFLFLFKLCFVSCSFGKDSIVVLHLIRKHRSDIPVVFNNTFVQHPETYAYIKEMKELWDLNLFETLPTEGWDFFKVANKFGLPNGKKRADQCCYYLKLKPTNQLAKEHKWDVNFTGTTVLESSNRMFHVCERGQSYLSKKDKIIKVHPIAYWTDDEVYRYIEENEIPLNPAYSKYKIKRLGCVPCTSYKIWREQLARMNFKLYKIISEKYFKQPLIHQFMEAET